MKIYLNGFYKLILRLLYSKLGTNIKDLNSKIKLLNLITHEYTIAGIYKEINSNLDPGKEDEGDDFSKLPKINYGSKLTINIVRNQIIDVENSGETNNIFINVLFDDDLVQTIKLSDFIEKINSYIPDESFFENLC